MRCIHHKKSLSRNTCRFKCCNNIRMNTPPSSDTRDINLNNLRITKLNEKNRKICFNNMQSCAFESILVRCRVYPINDEYCFPTLSNGNGEQR